MSIKSTVKETDVFILFSEETGVPMTITVPISDEGTDNGNIEYGRSIASVVAYVYNLDTGIDVTSNMLDTPATESDNVITVVLNYYQEGNYYVKIVMTLDNGDIRKLYIPHIKAYEQ